jgi:PAS domain S-box-containing protein
MSEPEIDPAEAMAVLETLAGALFTGGPPNKGSVTWADRAALAPLTGPDAHRRAEARFHTLVQQIPAVTFMAALGSGENDIYVSPHVEQLLGFSQDEWLANPFLWYEQLHEDDRVLWNEEFARGCRTGGPFRAECRFRARDGAVKWVRGEARLHCDELGRPEFLQGVAFDITDAKRAQEIVLERAVAKAKIEEELAIARRVQLSLVPRSASLPGLEVAVEMVPAEDVGGDFVEARATADGGWLAIGDVSGHGLSAGLVMLMVQSAMAGICQATPDAAPSEVVAHLNEVVHDNLRTRMRQDDYVTLVVLRYHRDGRLCISGGHLDLLIKRRATGAVEVHRTRGAWVGAMSGLGDGAYFDDELRLEDGDVVVLYTDGITEATDAARHQLGLEPLEALVRAAPFDARAICERVILLARDHMHRQDDDMTVLAFRYHAPEVEP